MGLMLRWPWVAFIAVGLFGCLMLASGCIEPKRHGQAFIWNRTYGPVRLEIVTRGGDCELLKEHGEGFLREDDFRDDRAYHVELIEGHAISLDGCLARVTLAGRSHGLIWTPGKRISVSETALPSELERQVPLLEILARPEPEGPQAEEGRPWDGFRVRASQGMGTFTLLDRDAPPAMSACDGDPIQPPALTVTGGPLDGRELVAVQRDAASGCTRLDFGLDSATPAPAIDGPQDGGPPAADEDDAGVGGSDGGLGRADWSDFDRRSPGPRALACVPASMVGFVPGDLVSERGAGATLSSDEGRVLRVGERLSTRGRPQTDAGMAGELEELVLQLWPSSLEVVARPDPCGLMRAQDGSLLLPLRLSVDGERVPVGRVHPMGDSRMYFGRVAWDVLERRVVGAWAEARP